MINVALFIISVLILIVLLNVLIYKLILRRVIRKYIIPTLNNKGYDYIDSKFPGFLNTGDYSESIVQIRPFTKGMFLTIYNYVYYENGDEKKRTTVKIQIIFGFIYRVEAKDFGVLLKIPK